MTSWKGYQDHSEQRYIWILVWVMSSRKILTKSLKMEEENKFVTKEASSIWGFLQWYFAKWEQEQKVEISNTTLVGCRSKSLMTEEHKEDKQSWLRRKTEDEALRSHWHDIKGLKIANIWGKRGENRLTILQERNSAQFRDLSRCLGSQKKARPGPRTLCYPSHPNTSHQRSLLSHFHEDEAT